MQRSSEKKNSIWIKRVNSGEKINRVNMLISFRANTTPRLPLNNFRKTHCRRHRPAEDHFLPHRRLRNGCQAFPRILGRFDLLLFSLRHTSILVPRLHPLLLRPFAEGYGSGFQLHGLPKQCCWNLLLFDCAYLDKLCAGLLLLSWTPQQPEYQACLPGLVTKAI